MGYMITVQKRADDTFEVTVASEKNADASVHTVRVDTAYVEQLGWEVENTATLIRKSFKFLLDREPKEAILSKFELRDIAQYFPDYEHSVSKQ